MKNKTLVAVVAFWTTSVFGYSESTHSVIAEHATRASQLDKDSSALQALGLGNSSDDRSYLLPSSSPYRLTLTPMRLIGRGVMQEDEGDRPTRHFFDAQHGGSGLTVGLSFQSSRDWALELEQDSSGQEFSYKDAKRWLRSSLTQPSKVERAKYLGRAFESLGRVIHHLEDMAQPQHVRNDVHCDRVVVPLFGIPIPFPLCPATGTYQPSAYEAFTRERGTGIPMNGYAPVDYGTFGLPQTMWERGGIADFTSINLVSQRTNFHREAGYFRSHEEYPFPDASRAVIIARQVTDADLLGPKGASQPLEGEIWFVGTPVIDRYRDAEFLNQFTATFSIFSEDLERAGERQILSLNRFNYRAANEILMPRASAFSAGLIDYFFRGRIGLSVPTSGTYGVIDQAAPEEGFTRVKVALQNTTSPAVRPDGTVVEQAMAHGTLTLIAKYYLNNCYTPDLLGEFNGSTNLNGPITRNGCGFADYFGGVEMISVSRPLAGQSLSRDAPTEVTFDLSEQPIPVNAHDLSFQVVYEGTLGAEQDAVVVSATNSSEPTWLSIVNGSDYYAVDGQFYTPDEIRADPDLLARVGGANFDPEPLQGTRFSVAGVPVTQSGTVEAKGFHRIAVLADAEIRPPAAAPSPMTVQVQARYPSTFGATATTLTQPIRNQLARAPYTLSTIGTPRGIPVWHFIYFYKKTGVTPTGSAFQKPALVAPECRLPTGQYVCAPAPTPIALAAQ